MERTLGPAILALTLAACTEYDLNRDDKPPRHVDTGSPEEPEDSEPPADTGERDWCSFDDLDAQEVGTGDNCSTGEPGPFEPIVEWSAGSSSCSALPVVADLDQDGMPEILVNESFGIGTGTLKAYHGDGSGTLLTINAGLGYASSPAVGDIDGDHQPEIVLIREHSSSLYGDGDYTVAVYNNDGTMLWQSDHFTGMDFEYASAPVISDMDHDGSPEIVAGRVILNADGSTRGVGEHGRGSFGITEAFGMVFSEGGIPAVADLDLDGIEEVIVGNAMYTPEGETIWYDSSTLDFVTDYDGMVGVANLDSDIEGEFVAVTSTTVRAVDTDGTILWGPTALDGANIVSTPAIADIDGDGMNEVVVAGGNEIVAFNHDGTKLWSNAVTDETGATGASFFDFEGDGELEVVYIDEIEMFVYEGATGGIKFYSDQHASQTMYDYPVIADVDADGHAEIVVCHDGWTSAMSVYGNADDSWPDTRELWNQHAYSITNVNDDLSIPTTATPNFRSYDSWHAAPQRDSTNESGDDLEAEIVQVCEDECVDGVVYAVVRALNKGEQQLAAGVELTLYAVVDGRDERLTTVTTADPMRSGWSSEAMVIELTPEELADASALWLAVDDDGTGTGAITECAEQNNGFLYGGPFCE